MSFLYSPTTSTLWSAPRPPQTHTRSLTEPVVGGSGVFFPLTEIMSGVLLTSRKQLLIKEELFGWAGTIVFH